MEEEGQGRGGRGVEDGRRQVEFSSHVEGVVAEEVNDEGDELTRRRGRREASAWGTGRRDNRHVWRLILCFWFFHLK